MKDVFKMSTVRPVRRRDAIFSGALAIAGLAVAGWPNALRAKSLRGPVNVDYRGVAIGGYDPVSYFRADGPLRGSSAFEAQWSGAAWRFSSEQAMSEFADDPARYAPAFGGHCAWAMANGRLHAADPLTWDRIDERVYLKASASARDAWLKDPRRFIAEAEERWAQIIQAY